jgi:hypothetical protein
MTVSEYELIEILVFLRCLPMFNFHQSKLFFYDSFLKEMHQNLFSVFAFG